MKYFIYSTVVITISVFMLLICKPITVSDNYVERITIETETVVYVEPTPILRYDDTYIDYDILVMIYEIAPMYAIEPEIIQAIIETESSGNPEAYNGNCIGLMQVNKVLHSDRMKELGVDNLYDPYGNILVGTDLLSDLLDQSENVVVALMRYHGETDIEERLLRGETSWYADKVIKRAYELSMLHQK